MNRHSDITGEMAEQNFKVISVPFGNYVVKIRVTPRNEFIDIVEIGVSKSFLSLRKKLATRGTHNVSDLYEE